MRTKPRKPSFRTRFFMICLALGLWAVALLLGGCAAGAKTSAAAVRQYALEYPSPAFGNLERVPGSIRVEPLSIARTFSTASMVYRSRPFVYGDDAYNRWKIKPSVMISDLLLRDMKSAGLFGGVFSNSDSESGDYALGGVIEELIRTGGKGRRQGRSRPECNPPQQEPPQHGQPPDFPEELPVRPDHGDVRRRIHGPGHEQGHGSAVDGRSSWIPIRR